MTFTHQTHCQRGHAFTKWRRNGWGVCRRCRSMWERRARLNNTAAAENKRAANRRRMARRREAARGGKPPLRGPARPFPKKPFCLRGHPRTPDNLDAARRCRICLRTVIAPAARRRRILRDLGYLEEA